MQLVEDICIILATVAFLAIAAGTFTIAYEQHVANGIGSVQVAVPAQPEQGYPQPMVPNQLPRDRGPEL